MNKEIQNFVEKYNNKLILAKYKFELVEGRTMLGTVKSHILNCLL